MLFCNFQCRHGATIQGPRQWNYYGSGKLAFGGNFYGAKRIRRLLSGLKLNPDSRKYVG